MTQELKDFKADIRDDLLQLQSSMDKSFELLWSAHNEGIRATNSAINSTNETLKELSKGINSLQLIMTENYAKKEEVNQMKKELKKEIVNTNNNLKEYKNNTIKLVLGVPSAIIAFVEIFKRLVN